ncbi:hypothetical protein GIB67_040300 [Kingdonia uniflora]|uniref:Pentatricopeptide repeat-containing protein n=1 Tax=Kingdonia uniflora TaxID=39325 RepID=A0A7J7MV95_9MAGN|nr:hypothetical protein GIB67_040300 [Kingdonia uniflora]
MICSTMNHGRKLFEEIPQRDAFVWNATMGPCEEALFLYRDMYFSGLLPDNYMFPSAVRSCAVLSALREGKEEHCNVIKNELGPGLSRFWEIDSGYGVKVGLNSNIPLVNTLIALYGKCKDVKRARSLFDQMDTRDLVSWNAMIAAYEQSGFSKKAIRLFREMQDKKIEYNYITMVSVISACTSLGAVSMGEWVHELIIRKGLQANVSVTNALIDMYVECGNIDLTKDIFQKLPKKSVVSWTTVIGACGNHGHGKVDLELFFNMVEEGVRPNVFAFTAVLTACRHSGLLEEGKKHFESMTRDYSILPGIEHCSCLVDLLGRVGLPVLAYEFIKRMPFKPDDCVWGALLGACRVHGNLEFAELVAEHLFLLDPQNTTYYILMWNMYADAGRWEDIERLKKLMNEKELKKIPGHSLVEIDKRFHQLLSSPKPCPL